MDSDMLPVQALVDLFSHMVSENAMKYVGWNECISRDQEVEGSKKAREWQTSVDRTLEEVSSMRVQSTLHRRGLVADLGGLCSFETNAEETSTKACAKIARGFGWLFGHQRWLLDMLHLQFDEMLLVGQGLQQGEAHLHQALCHPPLP